MAVIMPGANGSSPDPPPSPRLLAAAEAFRARFAASPRWAASAPGRVNLIGEHTDYNGGFVLPCAIDRRTIVLAAPREDRPDHHRIHFLDIDHEAELPRVDPPPGVDAHPERRRVGPERYLAAVMSRMGRSLRADLPALDVLVTSDVPIGAGLSSSAAMCVAMATVLEEVVGESLVPLEKARRCQQAEHDAGTPCGLMDPLISSAAEPGQAMLLDCESLAYRAVPLPDPREAILLVADTGVRHELSGGGGGGDEFGELGGALSELPGGAYAERRARCERCARELGVTSLRHATLEMLGDPAIDPIDRRLASHVITENTRTLLATKALLEGDLETLGSLMFQSHSSLRDFFQVSCDELDTLVDAAHRLHRQGQGVYGARMTGGGFGGCAVALVETELLPLVMAELSELFARTWSRMPELFTVIPSGGARRETL